MKLLIVANWKCNPQTLIEAKQIFNSIKRGIKNISPGLDRRAEIVICPSFVHLSHFYDTCRKNKMIKFGAQNCFWEEKGAFTGETSPVQISDLNCKYVILGHSERRRYFQESDEMINKKIKKCLELKLNPILCIGESLEEKTKGQTINILQSQIKNGLKKISKKEVQKISIAYEPIWAIGTGKACPVDQAQSMGLLIRKIMIQLYNRVVSKNIQILYGGSVNSKNAKSYIKEANLNGLLIGGASLKPKEFVQIIKNIAKGHTL